MSINIALENVLTGDEFRAGTIGNVAIVCWLKRPTSAAVARVETLFDRVVSGQPARGAFVVVTGRDVPPPDSEARDAFAASMKKRSERIFGSCLVIEGSGIRSAAVRAVTTAISLLGDLNPTPQVSATVEEAAATLQVLAGSAKEPVPSVADLVAACRKLREG